MVTTKNDAYDWWVPKDFNIKSTHEMDAYCDEWEAMWNGSTNMPDYLKNLKKDEKKDGKDDEKGDKNAKSAIPKGDKNKNSDSDKAEAASADGKPAAEGGLPSELTKGAPAADKEKVEDKAEAPAADGAPSELTKAPAAEPAKEAAPAAA